MMISGPWQRGRSALLIGWVKRDPFQGQGMLGRCRRESGGNQWPASQRRQGRFLEKEHPHQEGGGGGGGGGGRGRDIYGNAGETG